MESLASTSGTIRKTKSASIKTQFSYGSLTAKYLEVLQKDIESNEREQSRLTAEINRTRELMSQLEVLSERPEWPGSFIPVNALAYVPATIAHTGEHHVKLGDGTFTLMSVKETLQYLQRKLRRKEEQLYAFKKQQEQLEERYRLSINSSLEMADTEEMPHEIASEKGVAQKTAIGFYEVIESYDEKEEQAFYKRRQQYKSKKKVSKKQTKEHVDLFERLEELQEQENLRRELEDDAQCLERPLSNESTKNTIGDHADVSERVRVILRNSNLYKSLLEDDIIQQHCHASKATGKFSDIRQKLSNIEVNESDLNDLIVTALLNEPVVTYKANEINEDFKAETVFSSNEVTDNPMSYSTTNTSDNNADVIAFLDSIENDLKNWSF